MNEQMKTRIKLMLDELQELAEVEAIKKGSRNNQEDQQRVQKIHDLSVEMGVKCVPESKTCEMKAGARFSADDFKMVQALHDHSANLGAECGVFAGGIAPGADTSLKGGEGSGNFGHSGRAGEVGGSGEGAAGRSYDGSVKSEPDYLYCKSCSFKAGVGTVPDMLCPACKQKLYLKLAEKSVNLGNQIDKIRDSFDKQFRYPASASIGVSQPWIIETYDDKVIARFDDKYYEISYSISSDDEVIFATRENWIEVEKDFVPVKAMEDAVCVYGSAVKSSEDGHLGGYLVKFSNKDDLDTTGDYFDKETDYGFAPGKKTMHSQVFFHHTLPLKTKNGKTIKVDEQIGEATLTMDENGILTDAILFNHAKYLKAIRNAIKSVDAEGNPVLGWSSGTANHLVLREKQGKGNHIKRWPLGLDATLTFAPAGIRQGVGVVAAKSFIDNETNFDDSDEPETLTETAVKNGSVNVAADEHITETINKVVETKGQFVMKPEEIAAIIAAVKAALDAETAAKAAEVQRKKDEQAAFKTMLSDTLKEMGIKPAGQFSTKPAVKTGDQMVDERQGSAAVLKTQRGDDAFKAYNWFLHTGDASGIRTGEAYEEWQQTRNLKTEYNLLESTLYQGQEAVPTEVMNKIVEKRDPISILRAAGADVVQASSNAMVLPIEKNSPGVVAPATVDGSTAFYKQQEQPMDKVSATIYLFPLAQPIDLQLIDDSTFDIEAWWSRRTARRMALTENYYFILGSGSSMPQGLTYAGAGSAVTAAAAAAIAVGDIIGLYHDVKSEYRDNVSWFMSGTTEGTVRKLTGTPTYFLGNGGNMGGIGNTGYPQGAGGLVDFRSRVFNQNDMATIGANAISVVCGNMAAGYCITERKLLTVIRDPYTLSNKGCLNLVTYWRNSGYVINADAIKYIKHPSA